MFPCFSREVGHNNNNLLVSWCFQLGQPQKGYTRAENNNDNDSNDTQHFRKTILYYKTQYKGAGMSGMSSSLTLHGDGFEVQGFSL